MRGKKKKKRIDQLMDDTVHIEQDENFYFIAGYTEGGFPYGITWEEYEAEQRGKPVKADVFESEPMQELQLTERQFQEIVDTYDMYIEGMESFLNIETGDVHVLRTYDRDKEDEELSEIIEEGFYEIYFRIPVRESHEGYNDMVDFAETVKDKRLQSTLMHVLNGNKKIFRRFKDALSSDNREQSRYYQFVEERNRERVMDWLESLGFKAIIV